MSSVTVRVNRRFEASAERVFDAWLDPATLGRWLYATQGGQMLRVDVDPRVGGAYAIVERRPDGDAAHYGRYLEIDRPRRLVLTLALDPQARATASPWTSNPTGTAAGSPSPTKWRPNTRPTPIAPNRAGPRSSPRSRAISNTRSRTPVPHAKEQHP